MSSKAIKKRSKGFLSPNRGKSILLSMFSLILLACASLIPLLILNLSVSISNISENVFNTVLISLFAIISFIILNSFSTAKKTWYFKNSLRKRKNKVLPYLFFWFKPKKAFAGTAMKITMFFVKLFWFIIFLLPCILMVTAGIVLVTTGGVEINFLLAMILSALLFFVCGVCFYLYTIQCYFLADYIFLKNPKKGIPHAIKKSRELMNGKCSSLLLFKLSFLPKFLLCLFIVPAFFILPSYNQARAALAVNLMRPAKTAVQ